MHKVGIDLGKSAVKATCNGEAVVEFPPLLTKAGMRPFVETRADHMEISLDGQGWLVGEGARAGLASRWVTDEHKCGRDMLLLSLAAIGTLGLQGQVAVGTGVPAALWRTDGAALGDTLAGTHEYVWNGGARKVAIDVFVLPEPLGSYFYAILDRSGRIVDKALAREPVAIVDIGYRTVDIVIAHRGRLLDQSTRSTGHGMVVAFERVFTFLSATVGLLSDGERTEVFLSLVQGTPLRLKGMAVRDDVHHVLQEAKAELVDQIAGDIRSALSSAEYRTLLFTGGGADWLREHLVQHFPGARWVDEPRYANARGFYRYAAMRTAIPAATST